MLNSKLTLKLRLSIPKLKVLAEEVYILEREDYKAVERLFTTEYGGSLDDQIVAVLVMRDKDQARLFKRWIPLPLSELAEPGGCSDNAVETTYGRASREDVWTS